MILIVINMDEYTMLIYGYNYNDFHWLDNDKGIFCQKIGTIIKDSKSKKEYVLTTRSSLMSCKDIMGYYCVNGKNVYRQNLTIIFQHIGYDMIILGSNKGYFDHNMSELVSSDQYRLTKKNYSYDILNMKKYESPSKKEKYYIDTIYMEITDTTVNFDYHKIPMEYVNDDINNNKYLPSYQFNFKHEKINQVEPLMGNLIYDIKGSIIGMIHNIEDTINVTPIKYINNVLTKMFQNIGSKNQYFGINKFPLELYYDGMNVVVSKNTNIKIVNGSKNIKIGDGVISIDDKKVNDKLMIEDNYLKHEVMIDHYANLNNQMKIIVNRDGNNIELNIVGDMNENMLMVSDHPNYYGKQHDKNIINKCAIPYIIKNGLIIVRLTKESIDLIGNNGINISEKHKKINRLIILGCDNEELTKKHNFGYFYCGTIKKFNSLSDLVGNIAVKTFDNKNIIINV